MNKIILQSIIDNITMFFGVSQSDIFSGKKDTDTMELKQLFFYVCNKKGIPVASIQRFLQSNDYSIHHSNIVRGIKRMNEKVEDNQTYQDIVRVVELTNINAH